MSLKKIVYPHKGENEMKWIKFVYFTGIFSNKIYNNTLLMVNLDIFPSYLIFRVPQQSKIILWGGGGAGGGGL